MAIFSAQSCCVSSYYAIIEVPPSLGGGGSVGEFYFTSGSGTYGCWELLASDIGPATFTADTGPYVSCTECRQTDDNECCFEVQECVSPFDTYYLVYTGSPFTVGGYYYFQLYNDPSGCYILNNLKYSAVNDTIIYKDGPFIDCDDCSTKNNNFHFSSCCDNTVFLLTDVPSVLSVGDVYYVESDLFSGCSIVINPTPTYNIYSAQTLTPYVDCDDCISSYPCDCQVTNYCFSTIFPSLTGYNGTYSGVCCYNGNTYYERSVSGPFVFYDGVKWCLSTSLGGSCILHGNSPCLSSCPDLCEDYFFVGSCSTTTTTTNPCLTFDFDGIFDCFITSPPVPSPSPTPTLPPTSTPLPTPTPTVCSLNFTFSASSIPDPSPTPTPTPTPSPSPNVPVSGSVTFNLFDDAFDCPVTKKVYDCIQNRYYYINEPLVFNGVDIVTGQTFGAILNGTQTCLTYDSISNISSNAILDSIFEVYGFGCNTCQPFVTTTIAPPGCDGVLYNLIQKPYGFVTDGNIIFYEASNPGATEGILDPNTFVTNGVNFSLIDDIGNIQTSYFSGLTGNSFTITFSQGFNSVIYSGTPNTFLSSNNGIIYSPVLSTGLELVQSSNTIFNLNELVCVSYETGSTLCTCSLYLISQNMMGSSTYNYVDCQNNNQSITVAGNPKYICAKTNTVVPDDPLITPNLVGECCNLNCFSYQLINPIGGTTPNVTYVDCNQLVQSLTIIAGTSITVCAIENTVVNDGTVIINNLGPC